MLLVLATQKVDWIKKKLLYTPSNDSTAPPHFQLQTVYERHMNVITVSKSALYWQLLFVIHLQLGILPLAGNIQLPLSCLLLCLFCMQQSHTHTQVYMHTDLQLYSVWTHCACAHIILSKDLRRIQLTHTHTHQATLSRLVWANIINMALIDLLVWSECRSYPAMETRWVEGPSRIQFLLVCGTFTHKKLGLPNRVIYKLLIAGDMR